MSEYINGLEVAPVITVSEKHTYSTDEQVVGTWIDGKPLYEKTINIDGLNGDYPLSDFELDTMDTIVYFQAIWNNHSTVSNKNVACMTYNDNGRSDPVQGSIWFNMGNQSLHIKGNGSFTTTGWLTVHYTKTTDKTEVNE